MLLGSTKTTSFRIWAIQHGRGIAPLRGIRPHNVEDTTTWFLGTLLAHTVHARTACSPRSPARMDAVELFGGMRLTRKFILALVVGVALAALIQGFLDYRRER